MKKRRQTKLNCFSPPVMIATLTVESILTVYTLWRYKLDELIKLSALMLIGLASFQLAEYHVCTGFGATAEVWSRFGFAMITLLPPLGVHIMHNLAGKPAKKIVYGSYAAMAVFVGVFLTYRSAFIGHQCTGNYVIFQIGPNLTLAYSIYYYGLLLTGIGLGFKWMSELKEKGKDAYDRLQSVRALIVGYFIFLVPVAIANTIKPQTRHAIPSIMCGFAVLFALVLTFYILPKSAKIRKYNYTIPKAA